MIITRNYTMENTATSASQGAHAEGQRTTASGAYSHAEGWSTTANGNSSHAEGYQSSANALAAHSEGYSCTVNGGYGHAEGQSCSAGGSAAHAEGYNCIASGLYSHAQGAYAYAARFGQHAQGMPYSSINAVNSQRSVYVTGCTTTTGTAELTFDGSTTVQTSGASANVLAVNLKSTMLVRYDITARPSVLSTAPPYGAGWVGSILTARGNDSATPAAYSTAVGTAMTATTNVTTLAPSYFLEGSSQALSIQVSINTGNPNINYLRFVVSNPGAMLWSVVGVLQVTEVSC